MKGLVLDARDEALLQRAGMWRPELAWHELNESQVAAIVQEHGIEFATAVIHDRAQRAPEYREFQRVLRAESSLASPLVDVIGIVPGAFHGQHRHTGADGVRIAEVVRGLAPRVEIIPVRSFGGLEENAAIILDWLEAQPSGRVGLASLSKGGADVKRALASPRASAAFARVCAWISFSGIVQGTPLIAWLRARPLRSAAFGLLLRFQGNRSAVLDELRRAPNGPLAQWATLPPHLRVVHVNGCPTARHLQHKWAPRGYERLAPFGPNDGGGIVLGDLPALPGIVHTIWGADHYLQPAWDATGELRAVAAAALACDVPRQATQEASSPTKPPATRSNA